MNDSKKAFHAINIIMADWDPLNVGDSISKDEYIGYVPGIVQTLKKGESLFEHLSQILMNDWGSGFNPTNIQHIEDLKFICNEIINAYMKNYQV